MYGSEVWMAAAKTHIKKLSILQNSALRYITGGKRATPVDVLEADTCIWSIQEFLEHKSVQKFYRLHRMPSSYGAAELLRNYAQTTRKFLAERLKRRCKRVTFALKCRELKRELNLPEFPMEEKILLATTGPWTEQDLTPLVTQTAEDKQLKTEIRTAFQAKVTAKFTNSVKATKYRQLVPAPTVKATVATSLNFRQARTLFRLRTKVCNLNAYSWPRENGGNCPHCPNRETIEHVLLHCQHYRASRGALVQTLTPLMGGGRISPTTTLGMGQYTAEIREKIHTATVDFFRNTGRVI
jgi:hypothetical protein